MLGQFLINGIITGILYSLLAIGFALVYNTTKLFHIVAAAIYVFSAFMFYLFAVTLGLPILVAAFVTILLTMGLSLLTDVSVYRPLKKRKASGNVAMIASIGMMIAIINLLVMFFGTGEKSIKTVVCSSFSIGGLNVSIPQLWQLVVGVFVIVVFLLLISITNWGIRLRVLSEGGGLNENSGDNMSNTRTMVFLLSGVFIAISACLSLYDIGFSPYTGIEVFITAIMAMFIGGVGRYGTCVLGGIILGVLQAVTSYYLSSSWNNAVTFILLLIILFLRPQGIAGYKKQTV